MEKLMRKFFLFLSNNKLFTKAAKKYGLRVGAARFVAGETNQKAAEKIKDLNDKGLSVTLDYLGEFVTDASEARERADEYVDTIRTIAENNLDSQLSVKMTSMGMDISDDLIMENMKKILDAGKENGVFVTIDMEDYSRCQRTLEIFEEFRKDYDNVGTVIQAYLYRAAGDIKYLNKLNPNLRLVKGAYKESPEVAYPEKKDVDKNFRKLITMHLKNGNYTAVATHDDEIIRFTKKLVEQEEISRDQFEFQMLYGIRKELQEELVAEGYKVRVYIPYGKDWYGYFMRRLAESPANVAFVVKGVLKK
ncbi:proline dehydrogenase [Halalkalibacillus sediminis]|uniref:proline dehydrogenase n=1 Tax=Halalkalibacillus sediminis TaxID=2018042 RepID=A0A2I0QUN4_9BACI|nr:proline dehydrogenase [Halalkalibacillus sediminis]PKR78063.1 proline dehydrogenase [Halalkalibacillus sediminis]